MTSILCKDIALHFDQTFVGLNTDLLQLMLKLIMKFLILETKNYHSKVKIDFLCLEVLNSKIKTS